MSQPGPVESVYPRVAEEVIDDIRERMRVGVREYGVALQARNGRRALRDLYEELLDGAHYVRQRLDEEDEVLRTVVDDQSVRTSLTEIYDRAELIRKNPNRVNMQSLEKRYIDDIGYLRMVVEALLVELTSARATPPPPPAGTEVAVYQYGCAGNGKTIDHGDDYGQDWVDRWVADPDSLVEGYYPVYRPLYGGQWYRVDPENPPEPSYRSGYGLEAPGPTRDDGKPL